MVFIIIIIIMNQQQQQQQRWRKYHNGRTARTLTQTHERCTHARTHACARLKTAWRDDDWRI